MPGAGAFHFPRCHIVAAEGILVWSEKQTQSDRQTDTVTITDGMILFASCMLSFCIGYLVGVFRVSRFVTKELKRISGDIEQHRKELQQFISRLGDEEAKP
jgi:hypothetical protein